MRIKRKFKILIYERSRFNQIKYINQILKLHSLKQLNPFRYLSYLLFILGILLACVQLYQPQSPWEQRAYRQSRDDLYPEDFRQSFNQYKGEKVRWTGIIQESEFYENPEHYEVVLLMEHRYFDWKVEKVSSPDMMFLSRLGEGLFQTSWLLKKNADLEYFMDRFGRGNLAIVYATPDTVIDKVVLVETDYIRIIDPANFQAEQLDYVPSNVKNRPVPPTSYSK